MTTATRVEHVAYTPSPPKHQTATVVKLFLQCITALHAQTLHRANKLASTPTTTLLRTCVSNTKS